MIYTQHFKLQGISLQFLADSVKQNGNCVTLVLGETHVSHFGTNVLCPPSLILYLKWLNKLILIRNISLFSLMF